MLSSERVQKLKGEERRSTSKSSENVGTKTRKSCVVEADVALPESVRERSLSEPTGQATLISLMMHSTIVLPNMQGGWRGETIVQESNQQQQATSPKNE